MHTLILGGAPGANWVPLLLLLVAAFMACIAIEYTVKLIKRKLHNRHTHL